MTLTGQTRPASARFIAVIPARHASTRLPGKALADIAGRPMVVHVAERARASGARAVYVATDHRDIQKAVEAHGFEAVMTRRDHASGTDRIAEVAKKLDLAASAIVVNVQGDEPLIDPALIRNVAMRLAAERTAAVATACHPIHDAAEFLNPNAVKVVCDRAGMALYFSRSPIPHPRGWRGTDARGWEAGGGMVAKSRKLALPGALASYRHVGIYAYRAGFLAQYAGLASAPFERTEALEQLRVLWHGFRIAVMVCDEAPEAGVDTPEDLARVRRVFAHAAANQNSAVRDVARSKKKKKGKKI